MMLDVDFVELRQGFLKYLPIGGLVAVIFGIELALVMGTWKISPEAIATGKAMAQTPVEAMNVRALGRILYTENVYFFQLAGLILLVAMIGAIVLTLRERPGVKRQVVMDQNARTRATAMDVKNVAPGQGV